MNNVAFTGHRPDKLYGYKLDSAEYKKLEEVLISQLKQIILEYKSDIFISGGALGFDTLAFNCVKTLQKEYPIHQLLAIPFEKQDVKWTKVSVSNYRNMKKEANVVYVDTIEEYKVKDTEIGYYYPAKMQKRNEYMVDKCKILVACWNGDTSGGTYNCISYAKKNNKKILVIDPNTLNSYYL